MANIFKYEQEEINIGFAGGGRSSLIGFGAYQKLMEERSINVKSFSGASIGAVGAALFAAGKRSNYVMNFFGANGKSFSTPIVGKKYIREAIDSELGGMLFCHLPMECRISIYPIFNSAVPLITRGNAGNLTVGEVVAASCTLPGYYLPTFLEVQGKTAIVLDGGLIMNPPLHPTLKNMVFSYKYSSKGSWNSLRQITDGMADCLFKPDLNHGTFVRNRIEVMKTWLAGYEAMGEWLESGKWE